MGLNKPCSTHHLTKELPGRLDTTPGRDVFAFDDSRSRVCELLNEPFVGNDTSIEVDLCESLSVFGHLMTHMLSVRLTVAIKRCAEGGNHGDGPHALKDHHTAPDAHIIGPGPHNMMILALRVGHLTIVASGLLHHLDVGLALLWFHLGRCRGGGGSLLGVDQRKCSNVTHL